MEIDPKDLATIIQATVEALQKPPLQTKAEPVPELTAQEIIVPLSPFDGLDEEDIKYWATPYFDELQAKKAKLKPKEEDSNV